MPVSYPECRAQIGKYQNKLDNKRNRLCKNKRYNPNHPEKKFAKYCNYSRVPFSLNNNSAAFIPRPNTSTARHSNKANLLMFMLLMAQVRGVNMAPGVANSDRQITNYNDKVPPIPKMGGMLPHKILENPVAFTSGYKKNSFNPFSGVDAASMPHIKGVYKDKKNNIYQVKSEEEIKKTITNLKDNLLKNSELSQDDASNFEYYMKAQASENPIIISPLENSYARAANGKEAFNQCNLVETVLDGKGNKMGYALLFQEKQSDPTFNEVYDLAEGSPSQKGSNQENKNAISADVMLIGIDSLTGKLLIDAKREAYRKNTDDDLCHRHNNRFPVAGLAVANDRDYYSLRPGKTLPKPAELKNSLAANDNAAFYTLNPQNGIRTDINLILLRGEEKYTANDNNKTYLKRTEIPNEFVIYQPGGQEENQSLDRVIFDEEHSVWRYKNRMSHEKLNVVSEEGGKKIDLYGDYYNIYDSTGDKKVIGYLTKDGIKEYLPVYMDPLSKTWHVDKYKGWSAFSQEEEEVITELAIKIDPKGNYRGSLTNNRIYYGDAVIFSKVEDENVSSFDERYIEIYGKLVPVRNYKHQGSGVLYEVFDRNHPEKKGYPVAWSGTRWMFEKPDSVHLSPELAARITPAMLASDIDRSLLTAPDRRGIRTDKNNNMYILARDGFVKIEEQGNKLLIKGESNKKIFISFKDNRFTLFEPARKKRNLYLSDKKGAGEKCPSGDVLYEELETIGETDKVMTVRHRGDLDADIAENSLSAFRKSYQKCRVAIETDVLTTKDGEMVIFHDTHIGKMMEPDYNPDRNTGPNKRLDEMTLGELKNKKLLNPQRQPTDDTIITVQELIEDYIYQDGQSQFYLEVKDPKAILRVAKVINDRAAAHPELLDRFIIKFNMAEFPTPAHWHKGLREAGINKIIMANPVMSPFAADRINRLAENLPNPPDMELYDNASRAVYAWSNTPGGAVPNVEIVIKSTNSGFIDKVTKISKQGKYEEPTSLDIKNTVPGTPAYWVAIVKKYQKALGTYVPVTDRNMWKKGIIAGITVPNIAKPGNHSDITKAFYNNDSRCCYTLDDKLAKNEKEDMRENLAWNHGIGSNIITADDTDSIDTWFDKIGKLDKKAMPNPRFPLKEMQSSLSWSLEYYKRPYFSTVNIKGWDGDSSAWWGGQVCLWDNPYTQYPWVYRCDADQLYNYYKEFNTRVVNSDDTGAAIQLYSHDKRSCISAKDGYSSYYKFTDNCRVGNFVYAFWSPKGTQFWKRHNLYSIQ
ncbi:glycerophosphodiester phosphodiesterase family protein [Kalamiella sp. sgz302252]|uniref:glycerophosphodiester phosphodiesterase family protein n=1 Tax=Pantoea sp. sgz302252 TaxID=3341827 RepID=UPI0036D41F23